MAARLGKSIAESEPFVLSANWGLGGVAAGGSGARAGAGLAEED